MSIANELLKLQQLKEAGVLTEQEFVRAKESVLRSSSVPGGSVQPGLPNPAPHDAANHGHAAHKVNEADGAVMIWIQAGEFMMGDNEAFKASVHMVTLDGYYIYKNLVTVAMYKKFCDATGQAMPERPSWRWDKTDYPIVNVTWHDAVDYCQWAGASLPTEAEWEKAARGTDGRKYPWGNVWNPDNCFNSVDTEATSPGAVGSIPEGASPYGVMDMAGNVFQWCADWYEDDYYARSSQSNPSGARDGEFRVLRGGSWYADSSLEFRSANRSRVAPGIVKNHHGFRCVLRPD